VHIKTFEVIGLMGRDTPLKMVFNRDLNIVTGRNGSGKTSVLKLLWYIMSGNVLEALKEVSFKKATLETSEYICTVYRLTQFTCRIDWHDENGDWTFEDARDDDGDVVFNAEDEANSRLASIGSSVFLPTFRRIEGGFTLSGRNNSIARTKSDIEESLIALSKRLTNNSHVFVAALSTVDVVNLLVRQYTDLSEEYNNLQQNTSQDVITKIKAYKRDASDGDQLDSANQLLDDIRTQIEGMESAREEIMRPLEAVRTLAMKLFRHSGIKLGRNLNFGEAAGAISSDALSAGEKQMLSFIAYNSVYRDAVFLIDEPELSLHVDWQRQLFSILKSQQTNNQFVIATHSPFIYGKYPDKELLIDESRGDEEF